MASDAGTIATGHWHPPHSSAMRPARLVADGSRFRVMIEDGDEAPCAFEPYAFELGSVDISERIGRVPRRLAFGDGSLFVTADNDAIDAWLNSQSALRSGWIHELERFHPRLIAFAAVVILLVLGVYRFALPVLVEVAVVVTPPVVPELMSAGTLKTLDQTVFSPSALRDEETADIRAGFQRIASTSGRGLSGYNLNFRKGGYIGPNAFALPDGTLVITDELIRLADGDKDMIIGVLAHEIGHVEHDHSLRQLYRVAGMTGLIMLIAGDVGSGVEEILTDGAALLALSHSREAESQADRHSVELMAKAGFDPAAIGRFFALLEKDHGDRSETSMLSTHPGMPERRKAIDDYAATIRNSNAAGQ